MSFALEGRARCFLTSSRSRSPRRGVHGDGAESLAEEFEPAIVEAAAPPVQRRKCLRSPLRRAGQRRRRRVGTVEQCRSAADAARCDGSHEADEWIAPVRDPENVAQAQRELDEPDAPTWPTLEGLAAQAVGVFSAPAKRQHTVAKPETPSPSARSEQEWVRSSSRCVMTSSAFGPSARTSLRAAFVTTQDSEAGSGRMGSFRSGAMRVAALLAKLEEVTEDENRRSNHQPRRNQ